MFKNINLFGLLLIAASYGFFLKYSNLWILLLVLFSLFVSMYKNFSYKSVLIVGLILCVITLLNFIPDQYDLQYLHKLIEDRLHNYSPRNALRAYIDANYNTSNAEVINLLLFNIKSYQSELYQDIVGLNIVHLFVVSGFHINCLILLSNKLIANKYLKNTINGTIIVVFIYFLGFSLSIIRVLIQILLTKNKKLRKLTNFDLCCLNGLIIMFCFYNDAMSFSFLLIFIALITIHTILKFELCNWLNFVLINILVFASVCPIIIKFNDHLNLLSVLNTVLFSYIIVGLFFYLIIAVWIPFLFEFNNQFIGMVRSLIQMFNSYTQVIEISITSIGLVMYYFIWCLIISLSNNKKYYNYNYHGKNLQISKQL